MHLLLDVEREEWGEQYGKIRLASPLKKKGSADKQISVFDLKGLRVLIANHIGEVPKDIRFAAQRIVDVETPQARHINAARRVAGRSPISDEHAAALAGRPQNVIVAAIFKKTISGKELAELNDLDRPDAAGPCLFELPGYHDVKPWVHGLRRDVEQWRLGNLAWEDLSRGALLSGPPGTGKTLFAGAFATSLGFRLIATTVGAWQSAGHLDDTLNAMRKSFDDANDRRGAVLFIDEFDSVGTRPARPSGHRNDQYWQIVINEFLSLLNNLGEGVIVVGATNNPEWIDPAIMRAGRIENHFTLTLPDASTRAEILRYHTDRKFSLEDLAEIAGALDGKSAASLEKLVRYARKDARGENRELEVRDLRARLPEKRSYTLEQQFRLGVHEAGHALVSLALGYASSATIEIKGSFDPTATSFPGGQTSYELIDDYLPTEATLLNRIAIALAGMAAEAVVFQYRSIGSGGVVGSDVERATAIARRLVGSYGLGKTPVFLGTVEEVVGKPMPESLENEVVETLRVQYERAFNMLVDDRDRVVELAADVVAHGQVKIERDRQADAA
ncbi:AAA family ATPase [Sinorhizobium meliloti]|uniref:AAA family ATPase n=1 Tax=Rhizobium meliloti TaxID=382 RepID=UPI0013E3D82C|nr:AAA family ATPase [Sinorhizobium meliloti]